VDLRVVVGVKEFPLGRSQIVRVDGQHSEEVRVTSSVQQGSVLGTLLSVAYVKFFALTMWSNIRLFADNCIIYREIPDSSDIDNLQTDLNRLGDWAVENEMKVKPSKSKAVSLTKIKLRKRISYYFRDELMPESNSFKYVGLIICSDLIGQIMSLTDYERN
jgi:hypothetical protein